MTEETLQLYSYLIAVVSGILFWAGFLVFGFIARRYSSVFNKPTFHGLLMTAPSGILVYSILLILKSSLFVKNPAVSEAIQVTAYAFLALSGALCLAGILKFNRLIDELLKYKGQ
jgi:hypothetical protein